MIPHAQRRYAETEDLTDEEIAQMERMMAATPQKRVISRDGPPPPPQPAAPEPEEGPSVVALLIAGIGGGLTAYGVWKLCSWLIWGGDSGAASAQTATKSADLPFGVTPEDMKRYLMEVSD